MAVSTGFNAVLKMLSGGTCTLTSDKLSITGGTCTTIGYLDSYSMPVSRETIDTTAFGDKVRKVIPGFPAATVSGSGTYDFADTQQKAIWTEISAGLTAAEKVLIIREQGSKAIVKGYFTSATAGSAVGSKSTFAFEFTSNTLPNITT